MNLLTYSQETYPKLILQGKDSLCLLTMPQVKRINIAFVNLDFKTALSDTFRALNKRLDFVVNKQVQLIGSYENQLELKNRVISSSDEVITTYKKLDKSNNRKIKVLKVQRFILILSVGISTALYLAK